MNIFDYLPLGSGVEPITREELVRRTGWSDRQVRSEISKAKQIVPIVNVGKGYYIATDPDDPNLKAYIRSEQNRIKEISKGLKKHKWLLNFDAKQPILDVKG